MVLSFAVVLVSFAVGTGAFPADFSSQKAQAFYCGALDMVCLYFNGLLVRSQPLGCSLCSSFFTSQPLPGAPQRLAEAQPLPG